MVQLQIALLYIVLYYATSETIEGEGIMSETEDRREIIKSETDEREIIDVP
jgi:hypothetical protein